MGLKEKIASLCLAGLLGLAGTAKADFKKEQGIVLGGNMATSCLISGIGSRYHKKGFLKGCSKGLFAGAVMYGGKEIARHTEYEGIPFLGKIVHSAGVSMRDNVSKGDNIFSRYQMDFGPVLFSVDKKNFDAYLLPGSLAGLVYNVASGNEFDMEKTLSFGTPIFNFNRDKNAENMAGVEDVIGLTKANNVGIADYDVAGHELTHALQYREGTWLDHIIESESLLGGLKYIKLGPDAQLILLGLVPQYTMDYKNRPLEVEAMKGYSK